MKQNVAEFDQQQKGSASRDHLQICFLFWIACWQCVPYPWETGALPAVNVGFPI